MKQLSYKDEKGNILYGYSQRNMDMMAKWVKYGVILGYLMFLFILFLFWYMVKFKVLGHFIERCV